MPTREADIRGAINDAEDSLRAEGIDPSGSFVVRGADLEYGGDGPRYVDSLS